MLVQCSNKFQINARNPYCSSTAGSQGGQKICEWKSAVCFFLLLLLASFSLLLLVFVLVELLLSLWDFVVLIWNEMSHLFYLAKLISDRFLGFVAFPNNSCYRFILRVLFGSDEVSKQLLPPPYLRVLRKFPREHHRP